jgi:hypothetical protein
MTFEKGPAPDGPRRPSPDDRGGEEESYQTCPECGLPHTLNDTVCGFCGVRLSGRPVPPPGWNWRRSYEQAKWRYKLTSPKRSPQRLIKGMGERLLGFAIGGGLFALGAWLTIGGMEGEGLMKTVVGVLFLLYGAYAVYHTATRIDT